MAGEMTVPAADLAALEASLTEAIESASGLAELEEARLTALGKKGRIPELLQKLGGMAPEARKCFGQAVNQVKARVSAALDAR
jgi:phenylalanyl-tRNA synthetase alpha chain